MPIHDWTRLEPGDFHDFHQCWVVEIRNALNGGLLPHDSRAWAVFPALLKELYDKVGRPGPENGPCLRLLVRLRRRLVSSGSVDRIERAIPTVTYPRVIRPVGKSPPQYCDE